MASEKAAMAAAAAAAESGGGAVGAGGGPVPAGDATVGLKPKLGLLNGVSVIVGCIIGSGIFVTPTGVLRLVGSANVSLVVWALCGLFSMAGAYCYAELGCMMARTGADYVYIMTTFGRFPAFMRLWVECMVVRPCTQAVVSLTFGIYALRPFFQDCELPAHLVVLMALLAQGILTFINCWSTRWATRIQDFFLWAKLLAVSIIIVTGIVQLSKGGRVEHFTFENTETSITKIALSFYSGLFSYFGWHMLNFITGELKHPVRDLPRAIGISCVIVTIVYVMTNVAFFTILSPTEMLSSAAVAESFGKKVYGVMSWIIPVFVAMSTFGTINGILMTSSRLFFAGALENHMPELFAMVQAKQSTPVPAIILTTLISFVYLSTPDVFKLINYLGFSIWTSLGAGVLCLPVLRRTHPEMPRPIKISLFFPAAYLVATVFLIVFPAIDDPVEAGKGIIPIVSGVPVYFMFVSWSKKPKFFASAVAKATEFVQKLFLVLPSEKEA